MHSIATLTKFEKITVKEMKSARKNGAATPDLSALLVPVSASIKNALKKKNAEEKNNETL